MFSEAPSIPEPLRLMLGWHSCCAYKILYFALMRQWLISSALSQEALTQRALELLALPDDSPKILLDLGCGSGLSGEELTESGHTWVVSLRLFLHAREIKVISIAQFLDFHRPSMTLWMSRHQAHAEWGQECVPQRLRLACRALTSARLC